MRKAQISFRIAQERAQHLKHLAAQEHRTLSEQIVNMLEKAEVLEKLVQRIGEEDAADEALFDERITEPGGQPLRDYLKERSR